MVANRYTLSLHIHLTHSLLARIQKEAKRAAKLQAQTGQLPQSIPIVQPQPVQVPIPTNATARRPSTSQPGGGGGGTPKPGVGTPRPGSRAGSHASSIPAGATVSGGTGGVVSRPTSAVPRPGSAVPRPGSAIPRPVSAVPRPVAPQTQAQGQVKQEPGTPMDVDPLRGKKREREDNGLLVNGHTVNGNGNGGAYANGNGMMSGSLPPKPTLIMNAKAGTGSIRPRPTKKQRMVSKLF